MRSSGSRTTRHLPRHAAPSARSLRQLCVALLRQPRVPVDRDFERGIVAVVDDGVDQELLPVGRRQLVSRICSALVIGSPL